MDVRSASIEPVKMDDLVRRARMISVLLVVAGPPICCDGTNYEISVVAFFSQMNMMFFG